LTFLGGLPRFRPVGAGLGAGLPDRDLGGRPRFLFGVTYKILVRVSQK